MKLKLGSLKIAVDEVRAPVTSANFIRYVRSDIYNGASFYRAVRRDNQIADPFIDIVQGGIGLAVFAESFEPPFEPIPHETTNETGIRHLNGTISMGRMSVGTASSEFFVCIGDQPELDWGGRRNPDGYGFAAFGRIVDGMDLIHRIHLAPTTNDAPDNWPTLRGQLLSQPIYIESAQVVEHELPAPS